eukprot:TRINITY_DN3136_c0_g1_i1.p1 TRINITY_DN3136_c0_g1~~TRINITY_DN3136_c0_g1_i1.p1  ORF type:complete len:146 (-),score=40.02 TRINITY_DN3136_c0_g1_i1:46-432(-)
MSWQAHADANLANHGFDSYGVYGSNGAAWAKEKMQCGTEAEICDIVANVGSGNGTKFLASGPKIDGKKYFVTIADENHAIGKSGPESFICHKTGRAVIFVKYHDERLKTNNALPIVLKFKEYLAKIGF